MYASENWCHIDGSERELQKNTKIQSTNLNDKNVAFVSMLEKALNLETIMNGRSSRSLYYLEATSSTTRGVRLELATLDSVRLRDASLTCCE